MEFADYQIRRWTGLDITTPVCPEPPGGSAMGDITPQTAVHTPSTRSRRR